MLDFIVHFLAISDKNALQQYSCECYLRQLINQGKIRKIDLINLVSSNQLFYSNIYIFSFFIIEANFMRRSLVLSKSSEFEVIRVLVGDTNS
jgi:hypothetical protein